MSISDRLDQIEKRASAATPGPWRWTNEVRQRLLGDRHNDPSEIIRCAALLHPQKGDAEFIAHARTDVPALVAGYRSLLDLHADQGDRCANGCLDEGGSYYWPCDTYAVAAAAFGEIS